MISDKINLIRCYDRYNSILTNKQKLYFIDYYLNDFSLSEIAEKYNVSRNAILDALKIAKNKLLSIDKKLNYNNFFENLIIVCQNSHTKNEMIEKTKMLLLDLENKD